MADDQAWAIGAQIGSERAKEHRAHKQEMSDQQFQDKHDEIQGMIENLHDQLTAVPKDQRNTPDYLKMQDQLAQAIQDRNAHWKSVDQPNALSKFGKMLGKDLRFKKQEAPTPVAPPVYGQPTMDVNGEKVPTGPAYKVQGPQTPAQMKAAAEAAKLVAAGPVSPEQAATQQGKAESAKSLAEFQGKMKFYDQNHPEGAGPNATPEGKQARQDHINELINSTSGVKEPKEPIETWTDVKGAVAEEYPKGSGQYRILQQNKKGERHWGDALAPDAPKQGKLTNADEQRESYRLTHNIPSGQKLTWDQEKDFVKQLGLARNPFGPAHIEIAREGLNLREQESGLKDFMSLQKQLTPLERVISTSQQSEDYVKNPTGPGDVALTLAFFDAIKTTGVRFTKQEQDFIVNSRGVLDGFQAAYDRGFQGTVFSPDQRAIVASIVKKAGETAEKQKGILVGGAGQFNPKAAAAASGGGTTSNAGGASGSDIPPRPKPTKPGPSGAGMVYHRGDKKWHWSMTGNDDLGQVE